MSAEDLTVLPSREAHTIRRKSAHEPPDPETNRSSGKIWKVMAFSTIGREVAQGGSSSLPSVPSSLVYMTSSTFSSHPKSKTRKARKCVRVG